MWAPPATRSGEGMKGATFLRALSWARLGATSEPPGCGGAGAEGGGNHPPWAPCPDSWQRGASRDLRAGLVGTGGAFLCAQQRAGPGRGGQGSGSRPGLLTLCHLGPAWPLKALVSSPVLWAGVWPAGYLRASQGFYDFFGKVSFGLLDKGWGPASCTPHVSSPPRAPVRPCLPSSPPAPPPAAPGP